MSLVVALIANFFTLVLYWITEVIEDGLAVLFELSIKAFECWKPALAALAVVETTVSIASSEGTLAAKWLFLAPLVWPIVPAVLWAVFFIVWAGIAVSQYEDV